MEVIARQYFAVGLESDMHPDASCLAPDETGIGCLIERQARYGAPWHMSLLSDNSLLPARLRENVKNTVKTVSRDTLWEFGNYLS